MARMVGRQWMNRAIELRVKPAFLDLNDINAHVLNS